MTTHKALIALAACAAIAGGCGEEEAERAAPAAAQPTPAQRHAQLERNPYDLRCADIRDKVGSAKMTRIVQFALADDAKIRDLSRLQAGQGIFFAITEICKAKPAGYRPAQDAIAGVRSGEFRADLALEDGDRRR